MYGEEANPIKCKSFSIAISVMKVGQSGKNPEKKFREIFFKCAGLLGQYWSVIMS